MLTSKQGSENELESNGRSSGMGTGRRCYYSAVTDIISPRSLLSLSGKIVVQFRSLIS